MSLFDGISVAQLALKRAGIEVDTYYASEIDKNAIAVTQHHFSNTIQLGDIVQWETWDIDWLNIDLLVGGSPCQGFSSSGKLLNFDDPRSKLFFEYVNILNHIKGVNPDIKFLLENVNMKQEWLDVISEHLGVKPILINSALVSAQNRVRQYWTNIQNIKQPEDRQIRLDDILEDTTWNHPGAVRGRRLNNATIVGRRLDNRGCRQDYDRSIPIAQCLEVRATNIDKSNCVTTVSKDNVLTPMPPGRYPNAFIEELPFRYYTTKEYCRLQTLPDDYLNGISDSAARKALGNCFTADVIVHILSQLKL